MVYSSSQNPIEWWLQNKYTIHDEPIWTNDNPAYKHIYAPVGFPLVLLANMRRTGLCKLIVSDTNLP